MFALSKKNGLFRISHFFKKTDIFSLRSQNFEKTYKINKEDTDFLHMMNTLFLKSDAVKKDLSKR